MQRLTIIVSHRPASTALAAVSGADANPGGVPIWRANGEGFLTAPPETPPADRN